MTGLTLFGLPRDPFREPEVIWGTVAIAVALLAGAVVIWATDRWRKRHAAGFDPTDQLTDFRALLEQGEITEEEYARLRERVARRVKAEASTPSHPPAGGLVSPPARPSADAPPSSPAPDS